MPRKAAIPAHDGGAKSTGTQRRRDAEKKRLNTNSLYKYRPYFVTGRLDLPEIAKMVIDDLGIDEPAEREKVLGRLRYFAAAQGWDELRQNHQDRLATAIEVRMTEEAVEEYMGTLRKAGDDLLAQGMIYVNALAPMSMPEAIDMVRAGKELGLRGRNMPDKVTGVSSVNIGTMHVDSKVLQVIQNLPQGDYAALTSALDASFADALAGRAVTEGRYVAVGTGAQREPSQEG